MRGGAALPRQHISPRFSENLRRHFYDYLREVLMRVVYAIGWPNAEDKAEPSAMIKGQSRGTCRRPRFRF